VAKPDLAQPFQAGLPNEKDFQKRSMPVVRTDPQGTGTLKLLCNQKTSQEKISFCLHPEAESFWY